MRPEVQKISFDEVATNVDKNGDLADHYVDVSVQEDIRICPVRWLKTLLTNPHPGIKLCNQLNLMLVDLSVDEMKVLSNLDCLKNIKYLRLDSTNLSARGIEALLGGKNFQDLVELQIWRSDFSMEIVESMVKFLRTSKIEKLVLWNSNFENGSLSYLLTRSDWSSLEFMDLGLCQFDEDDWLDFCVRSSFPSLEHIDLMGCFENSSDGLVQLFMSKSLPKLSRWSLGSCLLDERFVQAFKKFSTRVKPTYFDAEYAKISTKDFCAMQETMSLVKFLDLSDTDMDIGELSFDGLGCLEDLRLEHLIEDGRALVNKLKSINTNKLTGLHVRGGKIDDVNLIKLSRLGFNSLQVVDVSITSIGNDGLSVLGGDGFGAIEYLNFNATDVDICGSSDVFKLKGFQNLEFLSMSSNSLDDLDGFGFLKPLRKLEGIDLAGNPIGDDGLEALLTSDLGRVWKELWINNCGLSEKSGFLLANHPALKSLTKLVLNKEEIGPNGAHALGDSDVLNIYIKDRYGL